MYACCVYVHMYVCLFAYLYACMQASEYIKRNFVFISICKEWQRPHAASESQLSATLSLCLSFSSPFPSLSISPTHAFRCEWRRLTILIKYVFAAARVEYILFPFLYPSTIGQKGYIIPGLPVTLHNNSIDKGKKV